MEANRWRKRALRHVIVTMGLLLFYRGQGRAEVVQLDLFSLDMPATFNGDSPSWQTDFDLGVTFAEITDVYIDWSGEVTGGIAIVNPPGTPYSGPAPAGVYASLGSNPYWRGTEIYKGMDKYPNPEPFDLASEIELIGDSTWSDLLDGQGKIEVGYAEIVMLYGYYTEHGSVTLTKAILVVDGSVIPEPASLLLLAFGAVWTRLIHPKRVIR